MQMNSSPQAVLAIAPGKRELGIAVFVGADLVYFAVKTIRNRRASNLLQKEVDGILRKLFRNFSVKTVITKSISRYQKLSSDLESIAEHIKSESRKRDLRVREISLEQIKSVFGQNRKITQKKAFETLLTFYPQLRRYWHRPNKWQNDYYAFLFSAVAVGAVYVKTFSDRNQRENHFTKSGVSSDTAAPEF